MYVSGNYAYITGGFIGLKVINISTPSSPSLEGTYYIDDHAYDVYVSGNYVYVANGNAEEDLVIYQY